MFKTLLRTPARAAGEKAAADPQRRVAMASFMVRECRVNYGYGTYDTNTRSRCLVPRLQTTLFFGSLRIGDVGTFFI